MLKTMMTDLSYPIGEMGDIINIPRRHSLDGKIEFSISNGLDTKSYPIVNDIDNEIHVPKTLNNNIVPEFATLRTSADIHSLTVEIVELKEPIRTLGFLFRKFLHILPK
jgi:hypothetical protein